MSDQLSCKKCRESLCGRRYIQVEDGPHCTTCYDRLYANTCQECKELIGHNTKVDLPGQSHHARAKFNPCTSKSAFHANLAFDCYSTQVSTCGADVSILPQEQMFLI